MTPEYIEELADIADHGKLWKLGWPAQQDLLEADRQKLDTGIALRRYAAHVRRLQVLLKEQRSLLITPLAENSQALLPFDTPPEHTRLRPGNR